MLMIPSSTFSPSLVFGVCNTRKGGWEGEIYMLLKSMLGSLLSYTLEWLALWQLQCQVWGGLYDCQGNCTLSFFLPSSSHATWKVLLTMLWWEGAAVRWIPTPHSSCPFPSSQFYGIRVEPQSGRGAIGVMNCEQVIEQVATGSVSTHTKRMLQDFGSVLHIISLICCLTQQQ